MSKLLTPAEVARKVGVHTNTVLNAIHRSELPAQRVGPQYVIDEAAVQAWAARYSRKPRRRRAA